MAAGRNDTAGRATEDALEIARDPHRGGGLLATIISALALLFSGYSVYETVLKVPQIATYVPPRIAYTDPDRPENPFEVFIVPLTLANDGARTGTVLAVELKVTNPRTNKSKLFYAANIGTWGSKPQRPFAPVSLSGRTAFSDAIQFFPRAGETVPRILDQEAGDYTFEITARMVAPGKGDLFPPSAPKPLIFQMHAGALDYRYFNGDGTMPMWSPDYQSAATPN